MTDTYRTTTNPYATKTEEARTKTEEARTKLQRERSTAAALEARREAFLAEVNVGLAPFQVYRKRGGVGEHNEVRLTHPDCTDTYYLCDEDLMFEDLPCRLSTAHFARCIEQLEASIKKQAARRAIVRRAVEPVSHTIIGTPLATVVHYTIRGDFEWGRVLFVFVCCLPFNLWYFGTFKRSTP
jgi:hypothetical protein